MPGDGCVRRIRQPDFLETHAPQTFRHRVARHRREEPLEQHSIHVVNRQRGLDCAANEPRPAAQQRDRPLGLFGVRQERFLREPGLMPQAVQLPRVDLVSGRFETLLQQTGQREIHVVAAEQDVLADSDALERELTLPLRYRDQAEVRGSAADIADQHQIADLDPAPPLVAKRVQPGIERRLRFFEQRDAFEAGRAAPREASALAPPHRMTPAP